MGHEIGADHDQMLVFPLCPEDWVPADHPARFIRDFVDSLDLSGFRDGWSASEVGRPHYGAELLLSVWLYGYLNGIRSTRKLERACREQMGLIWLTGRHEPDHNSLWRFLRVNREAIRTIFKQSVQVAARAKLVGLVLHAVDGTKIMAASSRRRMWHREDLEKLLEKIDESIDEVVDQIESAQRTEAGEYHLPQELQDPAQRKAVIRDCLRELDKAKRDHIQPLEPDARLMKHARTTELSYNGQVVVDEHSGMIVASEVVTDENDLGQLVPMVEQVVENLGAPAQETVGDGGYASAEQFALADREGYEVLTSPGSTERPARRGDASGVYHASAFTYDSEHDNCICPHGERLTYERTKASRRKKHMVRVYRCRSFRTCPFAGQCSRDGRGRSVEIGPYHAALLKQRRKRQEPMKAAQLRARTWIVEPVFGWIKRNLDFRRWTVFGLESVRTQWALICTTINLKKLYTYWVQGELVLVQK